MKLSEELKWRGLIKDRTFGDETWLDQPQTLYHGVDGSADSLTVGNLAALMLVRHLLSHGWQGVLLIGGATSLIGDPGGKQTERTLPDEKAVASNVEAIKKQVQKLFSEQKSQIVNNIDWLAGLTLLDFLRDIGKNYSMTELLQREFISERIGDGGAGISYAEFSYTLIQGYDFWHLYKNFDVKLQIGGSDQWGNMLSGVALIRKKEAAEAHAMSMSLIVNKATGKKFGKSEEGAIWLDPEKTSPTQFYQFWVNVDDTDAEDYLKIFTLLNREQIEAKMTEHKSSPEKRLAQQTLASQVTELVHGREETHTAEVVTNILTGAAAVSEVSDGIIKHVRSEIPSVSVSSGSSLVDALVSSGLASSNSDARRLLTSKAVYINNQTTTKENFEQSDFQKGRLIIRRGKAFKDSALVELI